MRNKAGALAAVTAVLCAAVWVQPAAASEKQGQTGGFTVEGGTAGEDYSYRNGKLTILSEEELTISGRVREGGIVVKSGVDASITLKDLTINGKVCPLELEGSDVTVMLEGDNTLTNSGTEPAVRVPGNASLTIRGEESASLRAKGGADAAGIGGTAGSGRAFGDITFDGGTVNAAGGSRGAGIGSGVGGGSGKITVASGDISASGGTAAADVGNETGSSRKCTVTLDGNGILRADEVAGTLHTRQGILLSDTQASVYGSPELEADLTIRQGTSLYIEQNAELTVSQDASLTNRGQITVYGTLCVDGNLDNRGGGIYVYGDGLILGEENIQGNEPEEIEAGVILIGQGDVLITSDGYKQNGTAHSMTGGEKRMLRGSGGKTGHRITVEEHVTATLYLDQVQIQAEDGKSALEIGKGSSLTLVLTGANVMEADKLADAISLADGAGLQIQGGGTLTLEGAHDRNRMTWKGTTGEDSALKKEGSDNAEEAKDGETEEKDAREGSGRSDEDGSSGEGQDAGSGREKSSGASSEETSSEEASSEDARTVYNLTLAPGESLTAAQAEANGEEGFLLEITAGGTAQNGYRLELSRSAVQKLIDQEASLGMKTSLASIELDTNALKDLQRVTKGDLSILISPFSLNGANFAVAKAAIGSLPVCDIQIIEKTAGGSAVKNISFGTGKARVWIPCRQPERGEELQMVYVGADNTLQWLEDSYYDEEARAFTSSVSHFSVYGVARCQEQTVTEGWRKEADGSYSYYYADGSRAVNTTIDGYQIDAQGRRKEKLQESTKK